MYTCADELPTGDAENTDTQDRPKDQMGMRTKQVCGQ